MADLEGLIARTVSIPAVPHVLMRMQEVVNNPKSSILDAVAVIEEDPGLGIRCLRIANSAIYGLRVPASSLRHAASVLGMRKLQELALQSSLVSQFEHLKKQKAFNTDVFWQHGAVCAVVARHLAKNTRQFRGPAAETAASCGLLHNIGRLAMVDTYRAAYLDVILPVGGHGDAATQAETEAFGFDHAQVGGILAGKWNLAAKVIEIARDHHQPRSGGITLAGVVGYASQLSHAFLTSGDKGLRDLLNSECSAFLNMTPETLEEVTHAIIEQSVNAVMISN